MGSRGLNLLSARAVETAKPREAEYYLRDGGGLFVRVYPSGLRRACYRFDDAEGRTRRVEHAKPLGKGDGELSLADARAWRDELTGLRQRGVDPVAAELAKRQAHALRVAAKAPAPKRAGREVNIGTKNTDVEPPVAVPLVYRSGTFGAIAEEFYTRVIERTYKDPSQVRRILDADLLPALGALPMATLRLGEVQAVLNAIVDRGAPVAANRALLIAKKVTKYARVQGHCDVNVLADISRRDVGGREGQRERALSDAEIQTFWRTISTHTGLSWQVRACLLFLLLTGQRIGETLLAQWGHLDLQAGTWSLPAENTKSKRAHLVHLGPIALALLATLPKPAKGPGWLFHDGSEDGAEPITRRAVTRALDRLLAAPKGKAPALPLDHFTPHDLRRSVRSRLSDLGVLPHVAEKLLNHQLGGVLQVYDRGEYLTERAQAMAAWDTKLRELLADPAGQIAFAPAPEQATDKAARSTRPRRPGLTTTATHGGDHG